MSRSTIIFITLSLIIYDYGLGQNITPIYKSEQEKLKEEFRIMDSDESIKKQQEILNAAIQGQENDINFFGKVVDEHNDPMPGVEVSIGVIYYEPKPGYPMGYKTVTLMTDSQGEFSIDSLRGMELSLENLHKKNYHYNIKSNPNRSFSYNKSQISESLYGKTKETPAIFKLKKKNPGFVTFHTKRIKTGGTRSDYEIDLIEGDVEKSGKLKKENVDLKLIVTPLEESKKYKITIIPANENGKVSLGDESSHTSYKRSVECIVDTFGKFKKWYIYCNGGNAWGYSRLELRARLERSGIAMNTTILTNLEGTQNLEYDYEYTNKKKGELKKKTKPSDKMDKKTEKLMKRLGIKKKEK